ncbi:MAG: YdiU family protein, partial [Halobacteria archaeon]|nr:YdiU family protein [Halobacteria archaeon]
PTPFASRAELLHFNASAAALLDLDPDIEQHPALADIFSGKQLLAGSDPLAMLYAGHQFGHYVPQLGDGRAIMLGEITNQRGEKWELQRKGSGLTPYSRDGDGRAVLRSSIREYLCSEAMHGLGIPTTRALCLVGSRDEVYREQIETGAMLTRLAPSHVRFGSFEVFYYRNQYEHLQTLADYVIKHHYPDLQDEPEPYTVLLHSIIERTAHLLAQWQAVGFAHGVMNTDNMSILGLTLDYGPFGFMEGYNPGFICNHSDHRGRYAFDQQPQIGLWNLTCLAQAMTPLIEVDTAKAALQTYQDRFTDYYYPLMAQKFGFEQPTDAVLQLVGDLLDQMQRSQADYTRLFRGLGDIQANSKETHPELRDMFLQRERFDRWLAEYRELLRSDARPDAERREMMMAVNPKYVLRNYLAQIAIENAEQNQDYSEMDRLMQVLRAPFDEHPEMAHYAEPPPDWADGIQVSCSS